MIDWESRLRQSNLNFSGVGVRTVSLRYRLIAVLAVVRVGDVRRGVTVPTVTTQSLK